MDTQQSNHLLNILRCTQYSFNFQQSFSDMKENIHDLFSSNHHMDRNFYDSHSAEIELGANCLTFSDPSREQLESTNFQVHMAEKERPIKMILAGYQSKLSIISSTKRSNFEQNEEFLPCKNKIPIFYSDQQHSQNRDCNSSQFDSKVPEKPYSSKKNMQIEKQSPILEGAVQQIFNVKKADYNQKQKHQKNQTPKIATRNMLQYFWKVIKNYFTGKKQQLNSANEVENSANEVEMLKMKQIWQQISNRDLKPSLSSFTIIFKNQKMRPYLQQIFISRYFMREVMRSSLKQTTKATYLRYVKVLLKGFLAKELQYLN